MNHSTNIVWGERGEIFLHEKAPRAYFCAGVHIILARIVVFYLYNNVCNDVTCAGMPVVRSICNEN